jgi:3',5'-nucleoside bisphosphate phosphatase
LNSDTENPTSPEQTPGAASAYLDGDGKSSGLPRSLRSRARHLAMLNLYTDEAHRFLPDRPLSEMLRWLCKDPPRRARARYLVEACLAELNNLDRLLTEALTEWSLNRLGAIERAVLRIATAEIIVLRDAPAGAVINDSVELARRYGEETSPGFVNAVLTQVTELPEVAEILSKPTSDQLLVDLHTHSNCSDGRFSPAELVRAANQAGMVGMALTDHDDVSGVDDAMAAGRELGMEIVPGVELTCYIGEAEIHVLGLFIDHKNESFLTALNDYREGRRRRVIEICSRLTKMGAELSPPDVYAQAGDGALGRPHIAAALVAAGHCSSIGAAFKKFIGNDSPACVPKVLLEPHQAVELIHEAGGLALLAHPGASRHEEMLPEMIEAGIDGLEVRHSQHPETVAAHFERMANRRDMCVSGGSDYHSPEIEGRPLGKPMVPQTWLIQLRNKHKLLNAVPEPMEPELNKSETLPAPELPVKGVEQETPAPELH